MPETKATLRYLRSSPYKAREVLGLIRGLEVEEAQRVLRFSERGAARDVLKVLNSAVANADNNLNLPPDELYVSVAFADEGPTIKRWRPRARGRATRIRKRTCHITVTVARLTDEQLQARRRREAAGVPGGRRRGVLPGRRRRGEEAAKEPAAAGGRRRGSAPEAPVEEMPAEVEDTSLSEAEPGPPEAAEAEAAGAEAETSEGEAEAEVESETEAAARAARYSNLGRHEDETAADKPETEAEEPVGGEEGTAPGQEAEPEEGK
jgi:large subunit ribosomal protein L22